MPRKGDATRSRHEETKRDAGWEGRRRPDDKEIRALGYSSVSKKMSSMVTA